MSGLSDFSFGDAFSRNIGLISRDEQEKLRRSLIVIAGCGGVGGFHAHTFARLGVGRFRITDPDTFSVGNFNRQIGATMATVGRNKAEVTAEIIRSVNPEAEIEVATTGLAVANAADFVREADLVVDGVDFFSLPARRALFKAAWEQNIPALTAAPLGFSGALLAFLRGGMSFDEYFDISDSTPMPDQIINFLIGLAPSGLHVPYMDLRAVDPNTGRGPSSVVGVQLAASLLATQGIRVLLDRGGVLSAPHFAQFDAYRLRFASGYLRGGNRNWKQRLKRKLVIHHFKKIGLFDRLQSAFSS